MKSAVAAPLLSFSVVLAACGPNAAGDKNAAPPPPPHVVVTWVVQRDQPVTQEWIGTTQGDVNADIRPKIEGYLLRRAYQEGSYVRRGQLLFEIDPRQADASLRQAQANLEQARAGLTKAEHDVQRFEPLAAQHALSQQELDNARSARTAAQATVGALEAAVQQARLNVDWTRVTSPISGIAGLAKGQVGDLVNPQAVLTTVSTVDPIRVEYQVSEQEYLQFRSDPAMQKAELELILADGTTFPRKGHIALSGRDVDVKTGTITTIGLFPNPGNVLRPGQYGKVRAVTAVRRGALLVPQRAVNELQGTEQIGVVRLDDTVDVRTVKTGARVGSDWIVEEGLQPGDRVIIEGFAKVKSGMKVVPEEAATKGEGRRATREGRRAKGEGKRASNDQRPANSDPRTANSVQRTATRNSAVGEPSPAGRVLLGQRPTVVNEDQSHAWTPDALRRGTGEHPLPTGEGRRGARIAESESPQSSQRSGGVRGQRPPRFSSQLLWWFPPSGNPSPRLFRAGFVKADSLHAGLRAPEPTLSRGERVAPVQFTCCVLASRPPTLPIFRAEGRRGRRIAESESLLSNRRSGGVSGQGLPRFTSQLLWWLPHRESSMSSTPGAKSLSNAAWHCRAPIAHTEPERTANREQRTAAREQRTANSDQRSATGAPPR